MHIAGAVRICCKGIMYSFIVISAAVLTRRVNGSYGYYIITRFGGTDVVIFTWSIVHARARDTFSAGHRLTHTPARLHTLTPIVYKVIVQCSYNTARHRHVKTARQNLMSIVLAVFLAPKTSAGPRFSTENFPPKKNCFQQISTTCARPRKKNVTTYNNIINAARIILYAPYL